MFTTSGVKLNKKDKNNESEDPDAANDESPDITEEIGNSDYDKNRKKFHFIITETDEMVLLPKLIEISDPYPGEPKWMRKRSSSHQISQVNQDNQYERWMLNELMLYTPYREADLDDYENNTAEIYKQIKKLDQKCQVESNGTPRKR
jgi:hypothetical protein